MYYFVSCRFRVHEKIRVLQFVSFLPVSKSCRVRVYNRVHELNSCRVRVYPPDTRNTKVHDTFIHDTNDLPGLRKLVPQTDTIHEHYVRKIKGKMTLEEKNELLKDIKVKNILHNSLDTIMSNRVIACKITKEIWNSL